MNLIKLNPRKSLNKAFLKVKPVRSDIERFRKNIITFLEHVNESESEEFHKNLLSNFLRETYYGSNYFINTKDRKDLVIHKNKNAASPAAVIIEAKKPSNKTEMPTAENINVKAFHELVLYYLRERITNKNLEIKYLIITNIYEWFIFDAGVFEKIFAQNKQFINHFTEFEEGRLLIRTTDLFYKEIATPFIDGLVADIPFTYFDIRDYEKFLKNNDPKDDSFLIPLYKIFSPEHLLKLPFINDSNTLDKSFYTELLHIIGLEETKAGGKKLIGRKKEGERNTASLIENVIIQLDTLDKISRLEKPQFFGVTNQERLFNVALELSITWVNRILFLKLLEAQLIKYNKGDKSFSFLNIEKVKDFDALNSLFFSVLAKNFNERSEDVKKLFANVPYLNSSLFEPTSLEHSCLFVSQIKEGKLPLLSSTVLKDSNGRKKTGELNTLEYLFEFLNSYDFASEGAEEIQEDNKTLINASVLGLIFEKINGYKDGSFFTPGFITMYMCRETIRRAVLQKFKDVRGWDCETIDQLFDKISDKKDANAIINSLKICDPAVGSGHFLVSALNEIIAIKSELKILLDRDGKTLRDYHVTVENDELIVTDEDGNLFEYNPKNPESRRVQEALFHEKETIIENCLFGVDINHNSVKICRLRLWIELLKNAYYTQKSNYAELETLPNIDINIKCGNSLVSRYPIDADLKNSFRKSKKWTIDGYRLNVAAYKNAKDKESKKAIEKAIDAIKKEFEVEIAFNDRRLIKLEKLEGELDREKNQLNLFDLKENQQLLFVQEEKQPELFKLSKSEKSESERHIKSLETEVAKLKKELDEIKDNKIYENAFEWRFEFPEVLNNDGDFIGFDVVIGNPPYGVDLSRMEQVVLNRTYDYGTTETAILFQKKGLEIINRCGVLSYILPKALSYASNYNRIRSEILKDLLFFVDCGKVWQDVKLEVCIFGVLKSSNVPYYDSLSLKDTLISYLTPINKQLCSSFGFLVNSLQKSEIELGLKIKKLGIPLGKLVANQRGGMFQNQVSDHGDVIVLGGAEIDRFIIKTELKRKTLKNMIDEEKSFIKTNSALVQNIVAHIENPTDHIKIICSIPDSTQDKVILDTVNQLIPINNDVSNKYLCALLNSKLVNWYTYRFIFGKAIRTMHFDNTTTDKIIFPLDPPPRLVTMIQLFVDQILALKKSDPEEDTSALEKEIDKLVYELYGLTEEEIALVENSARN